MRKLTESLWAKLVAVVLLVVLSAGAVLSTLGTMLVWSGMATAPSFYDDPLCNNTMHTAMSYAFWAETEDAPYMDYQQRLLNRYAGFAYEVWEGEPETGVLVGSLHLDQAQYVHTQTDIFNYTAPTDDSPAHYYTVVGYLIQDPPPYSAFAFYENVYSFLEPIANYITILTVVLALGALGALIFLFCAAGHRRGVEGIFPNWQDRIPLDLYLAAMGTACGTFFALAMGACSAIQYNLDISPASVFPLASGAVVSFLLSALTALAVLLSLATRLKLGKWWRNTLTWRALRWCGRLVKRMLRAVGNFTHILPMTWRTVLLVGSVLVAQIMLTLLAFDGNGFFLLVLLAMDGILVMAAAWLSMQLQQIKAAGQALAEGDLETKVDTRKMYWDLKTHGENLNAIGVGLNRAVEQRMKSERLKTELITNVSHDIKTPLTSIVNYVDLLKKEELPETAAEYLSVLDRQSRRLKKLTEDLVEASKASTGNVAVHLEPIVVNEIIHQAIGDYDEKLTAGKLEVIVNSYEGNRKAMADGRLLWRVLDNLLGNVCKYAMAGTRVYVDVTEINGSVKLSMKNISRDPLNVNPDELMERFVRGDVSRHTEGSGLGLNIARSLMELMGGSCVVSTDGDLFKAELTLRSAE